MQDSEIPLDGSGGNLLAWTDPDGSYANYVEQIDQTINQTFTQGAYGADAGPGLVGTPDGSIMQIVTIQQPVYAFDAFNDYAGDPGVRNNDTYGLESANIEVISQDGGWFEITQDISQNINQDIIQDVYYEIDLVQDFIQTQNINQTYNSEEILTATATRLAE